MVAPTAIGPEAYKSWRATSLGAVTEAIEQRLILVLLRHKFRRAERAVIAAWQQRHRDGGWRE
jgi:hypothetical protein